MPKKNSYKTTWNLGLLYAGPRDPQIEKDMRRLERLTMAFEKKYRSRTDYLKSDTKLLAALKDYDALFENIPHGRPAAYFSYAQDLNAADATVRAELSKLQQRYAKNDTRLSFFSLSIGRIPSALQKKFLASKKLAPYRYYLSRIFAEARHRLSDAEERIMSLKSMPSYDLWVEGTQRLTGTVEIDFGGRMMPLAEAIFVIHELPLPQRYELHGKVMDALEKLAPVSTNEINAIVINKKINDEVRGYAEPYDATILGYQNDRKSVLALIDTATKAFNISHRFYRLKAQMLGLPRLRYADRAVGVAQQIPQMPFEESVSVLRTVFASIDRRFSDILDSYLANGQIDVFPKKGKTSGAYCSGYPYLPTFVLLNHTGSLNQTMTFAHEMGHAIHTELAKKQPSHYQGYSTATAEVASTLFESFAFDAVFEGLSDDQKIAALASRINDDIQTIFRQVACFNFETELHRGIREKGSFSESDIRTLMNKHMKAYLGPIFDLDERDGNYFVDWTHLRRFFYVYSYAYGQLVSKALYARYKEDKTYLSKIISFMEAGESASPEDIFKAAGIDVTSSSFWRTGLHSIEQDIDKLEKLLKKS